MENFVIPTVMSSGEDITAVEPISDNPNRPTTSSEVLGAPDHINMVDRLGAVAVMPEPNAEVPEHTPPNDSNPTTTLNGNEINSTRPQMEFSEFKSMVGEWGLDGRTPQERLDVFKRMSPYQFMLFAADVNKRLQGSEETLISDRQSTTKSSGGEESKIKFIPPEYRYAMLNEVIENLQQNPGITPEKAGDVLALATVMAHPFVDGNGRTSRVLSMIFRDDFDDISAEQTFEVLSKSREAARKATGYAINGYSPNLQGKFDQSDPTLTAAHLKKVAEEQGPPSYFAPWA